MRVLALISLCFGASWASAHQAVDGDIYGSFGVTTYQTHQQHHRFTDPVVVSPALVAEADLTSHGGLEIGLFYLDNVFSTYDNGMSYTDRLKRIFITTGYRHWWVPKFSTALAFTSSYAMGNPITVQDDFGELDHPDTSAIDITEYGFELSLQFEPFSFGRFATVIDARYNLSITPKYHEDENHYGILFAVKYFIQSRDHARPEF